MLISDIWPLAKSVELIGLRNVSGATDRWLDWPTRGLFEFITISNVADNHQAGKDKKGGRTFYIEYDQADPSCSYAFAKLSTQCVQA